MTGELAEKQAKMTDNNALGGRLPLLIPADLQTDQESLYQQIDSTLIPWAHGVGFKGKLEDGRFIGPYNQFLYSPSVARGFLQFMGAEAKSTTLSKRVREVIILSVGAVWQSAYQLYAHAALARKAGISEQAITSLIAGEVSDDLSPEEVAAYHFARQLTATHKVDDETYGNAEATFGKQGIVDMTFLVGLYLYTSAALNVFQVGVPAAGSSGRIALRR
jgi:4-carboxymuconolactone decarboxylase